MHVSPRPSLSLVGELARGRRVAFAYTVLVLLTALVLALVPDHVQHEVILQSSTNLRNLRVHPLFVLFASAFVVSNLWGLWQLPLLLWGYGALERWLGPVAAVVVGVLGHVGATLFVATLLVAGIDHGQFDLAVRDVTDVGVSYGLAAVGGVLAVRVPRRWLTAYLLFISAFLLAGLFGFKTFTELGHLTAFVIGLGLGQLVHRAAAGSARLA